VISSACDCFIATKPTVTTTVTQTASTVTQAIRPLGVITTTTSSATATATLTATFELVEGPYGENCDFGIIGALQINDGFTTFPDTYDSDELFEACALFCLTFGEKHPELKAKSFRYMYYLRICL
jgi:hypothetical protein